MSKLPIVRAIHIDPVCKRFQLLEGPRPDLKMMYDLLRCEHIETVRISRNDSLVFDGHGRLHDVPQPAFQMWNADRTGFHDILGRGLVIGVSTAGNWVSTKLSVDEVMASVVFGQSQRPTPEPTVQAFSCVEEMMEWTTKRRFSITA